MTATGMKPVHGSQQLVVTLLASYFLDMSDDLPSAFFVSSMRDFDLSETATRNAVSRVARQGLLTSVRQGRDFHYVLSDMAHARQQRRLKQVVDYGRTHRDWDGEWTAVTFAVGEQHRHMRHQTRQLLRQLKLGQLYDGVWFSPWPLAAEDQQRLLELGVPKLTVLGRIGETAFASEGEPSRAFDLTALREALEAFISRSTEVADAMEDGAVSPTMALRLRTEALRDWRNLADMDPGLPSALLPTDWPLAEARSLFETIYDGLAASAEERIMHHLHIAAPGVLQPVRSLTTAEVAVLEVPT